MNKLKKFIKALYDSISMIFRFSLNLKIVPLIYFCQVNSTCLEINELKKIEVFTVQNYSIDYNITIQYHLLIPMRTSLKTFQLSIQIL